MASSESTYGQKPLYYGTTKKSPIYYGASQTPAYSGGQVPYYYGGGAYGGQPPGMDQDSLVGTVTLGRILRVISQRWISVLVFLLVGLVAAFAVYRISPTIYEAMSEFTMDIRRPQGTGNTLMEMGGPDLGVTYDEIFNTRLSDWRSDKIVKKIVQQYRANYPASTVSEKEIVETLQESELELVRRSRLITIAVRSTSPTLAAALANAYAEAIESFTDEENKLRCDKAVSQIHGQVEKQRRADQALAKRLLEFRTEHKIDNLDSEKEILQQSLQKTTADELVMQAEVTAAQEWEKVLQQAQETPERFAALPTSVPRAAEIAQAYTLMLTAQQELNSLLVTLTKNHPSVRAKEKEYESTKQHFEDAVSRALTTATGNLKAYQNQLAAFKKKKENFRERLNVIAQKIVSADAGLKQLDQEKQVASTILTDLIQKENEARILAEQNNEIIRVGRPATVPEKPVLPNPIIIFSAGAVLSLALGLLFVLVLDHLEDTVVSLADIEGRLSLKVLAVLPHVRRKTREQVAKFSFENKYSQFAEAVAGLRNLLDSPRYQPISQTLLLISTQPGEGKTVMSCSLAISSAQAGKRTLLVDFDLRRPRLARVWGLKIDADHSFSHYLSRKDGANDFQSLVMSSGVDHLDVICSLPPDDVDPAAVMGSAIVPAFFKWAREHYERIVIDSPPFGIVGDVVTLASMVDAVMIMCCPDRTHFKPIQHAVRTLGESGATVIGIVVNDVEIGAVGGGAFAPSSHSYGYGNYGGYRAYGGGYRPYAPTEGRQKSATPESAHAKPKEGGETVLSAPPSEAAHPDFADEE